MGPDIVSLWPLSMSPHLGPNCIVNQLPSLESDILSACGLYLFLHICNWHIDSLWPVSLFPHTWDLTYCQTLISIHVLKDLGPDILSACGLYHWPPSLKFVTLINNYIISGARLVITVMPSRGGNGLEKTYIVMVLIWTLLSALRSQVVKFSQMAWAQRSASEWNECRDFVF